MIPGAANHRIAAQIKHIKSHHATDGAFSTQIDLTKPSGDLRFFNCRWWRCDGLCLSRHSRVSRQSMTAEYSSAVRKAGSFEGTLPRCMLARFPVKMGDAGSSIHSLRRFRLCRWTIFATPNLSVLVASLKIWDSGMIRLHPSPHHHCVVSRVAVYTTLQFRG